ncbi:MAG: SPASM domain-containing protein [Bacteroidales bacterium]|nr:SPASM domain-containing protein [Bacteroidales bacterium]
MAYSLSLITKRPLIWGMPATINIEISSKCNLSCPECFKGAGRLNRDEGLMNIQMFEKIISELKSYLFNINLYFQGEPMLHPEFFSFVTIAEGIGITLSTNGHFFSDENIEKLVSSRIRRVIVPVDGMDQYTYEKYRSGGNLNLVLEGIRKLSRARAENKSSLKIEIQCLVNRYNQSQISELRRFARETCSTLKLKSMQIITGNFDEWLPDYNKYRRYIKEDNNYRLKGKLRSRCLRLWINPVITWDGKVLPCCFDKTAYYCLGNIGNSSFHEIWKGKINKNFRNIFLIERKKIDICKNCTTGLPDIAV